MTVELPPLPFDFDALEPHMSRRTLEFHYGKHHKAYVDATLAAIAGTEFERAGLLEIAQTAKARDNVRLFNNAAQAWNHAFFWNSLSPKGGGVAFGLLGEWINRNFGGPSGLHTAFKAVATGHFGSGWAWLVIKSGKLAVMSTHDAGTPALEDGITPLLTCDLWEHAYYLDYQNLRPTFVDAFLDKLANWDFAEANLRRWMAANGVAKSFLGAVFSAATPAEHV